MHFFIDWQLFPQALCVCTHVFQLFKKGTDVDTKPEHRCSRRMRSHKAVLISTTLLSSGCSDAVWQKHRRIHTGEIGAKALAGKMQLGKNSARKLGIAEHVPHWVFLSLTVTFENTV